MSRDPSDGGRWTYAVAGSETPCSFDGWIFERRAVDGKFEDAFNQYVGGGVAKTIYLRVQDDILLEFFSLEPTRPVRSLTYRPPLLLLPATFRVGQSWTWEGKFNRDKTTRHVEVVSVQARETCLGQRDVVHIRETDGTHTLDRWFARGLGLIRTERDGREVLRLTAWQSSREQPGARRR